MSKNVLHVVLESIAVEQEEFGVRLMSYSGRGMGGQRCLAITGIGVGCLLSCVVQEMVGFKGDHFTLAEGLSALRTDSLGQGTVMYFPGTEFSMEDERAYKAGRARRMGEG